MVEIFCSGLSMMTIEEMVEIVFFAFSASQVFFASEFQNKTFKANFGQ